MRNILSAILIAALLISCLSICVFAEEETTEAETEAASAQAPNHIVFNSEITGKKNIILNANHMVKGTGSVSKSNEWKGIKMEIDNAEDPHIGLDISKFFKRFEFESLTVEAAPFVVIKVLAEEILFDDFEIYYCAGDVLNFSEDYKTSSDFVHDNGNGELFFVYDLTDDAEGQYRTFRVDITGAEEGAVMYLTDIVFFASEEEALEWCGYNEEAEETTTEQVTEEQTEAETEQESAEETTKKPATTTKVEEEKGCGSVIGAGLVTVSLLALGVACTKKKD